MALRLVVPPSTEPLTVDEAKAHLRVTHAEEDLLIASYVEAARQRCETFQRRAYVTQTWELTLDEFPPGAILLPRPPIQSVESVKYTDETGTVQTLDERAYVVDTDSEPGRIVPAYGTFWPFTLCTPGAVRVRFVAGYGDGAADVPEVVRMAMRFYLGHYNTNREGVVTGTIATELPEGAKDLLRPDRA